MRKRTAVCLLLCLCVAGSISAQSEARSPELWWAFSPSAALPLGLNAPYFSTGVGFDVSAEYHHPSFGGLSLLFNAGISYVPVSVSNVGGVFDVVPSVGAAFQLPIPVTQALAGRVFANIGYAYV